MSDNGSIGYVEKKLREKADILNDFGRSCDFHAVSWCPVCGCQRAVKCIYLFNEFRCYYCKMCDVVFCKNEVLMNV